ncbi:hypothetical protein HDU98_000768 [Podochytrium sp. JEL0797]|nr:hypothetical protein HDU98_000768 [Podochytrium sp. JEL0797]
MLSDGCAQLLPGDSELLLARGATSFFMEATSNSTARKWRGDVARFTWAADAALAPNAKSPLGKDPHAALRQLDPMWRMQRLATVVDKLLLAAPALPPCNDFPAGYRCLLYAFETKSDQERRLRGIPPVAANSAKGKVIIKNNIAFRIDTYVYGHPAGRSYKFRSGPELKPHIIWLTYAKHACPEDAPQTPDEWAARDVALCQCIYCPHYVTRLRDDIYVPLTRPMQFQSGFKPKYDLLSPGAVFRLQEHVWARVVLDVDNDTGARRISIAQPVIVSLIDGLTRPFKLNVLTDKTAGGKVTYWPCVITSRARTDDGVMDAIVKAMARKKLTDGSHQGEDDGGPGLPMAVVYSVRLLGFPEVEGDETPEYVLNNVYAGSLEPYLAHKSRPEQNVAVLDPALSNVDTEVLQKAYSRALTEINTHATKWSLESNSAILFGNEILRIGDVLRLKPTNQFDANEHLFVVSRFDLTDDVGYVYGHSWEADDRFSASIYQLSTRVRTWKMLDDASMAKERPPREVRLDTVAGRMYPVVHEGLKVDSVFAGRYWHDWDELVNNYRAMPVTMKVQPRTTMTQHDDSDIVAFGAMKALQAAGRKALQIEGGGPSFPRTPAAASSSSARTTFNSSGTVLKRPVSSSQKALAESSDDEPIARRKQRKPNATPPSGTSSSTHKPSAVSNGGPSFQNITIKIPASRINTSSSSSTNKPFAAATSSFASQSKNVPTIAPACLPHDPSDSDSDDAMSLEVVIPADQDFDRMLNEEFELIDHRNPSPPPAASSSSAPTLKRSAPTSTVPPEYDHLLQQEGPPFVCGIEECDRSYPTLVKLAKHLAKKGPVCETEGCMFTCHRTVSLYYHNEDVHKGKVVGPGKVAAVGEGLVPSVEKPSDIPKLVGEEPKLHSAGGGASAETATPVQEPKKIVSNVSIMRKSVPSVGSSATPVLVAGGEGHGRKTPATTMPLGRGAALQSKVSIMLPSKQPPASGPEAILNKRWKTKFNQILCSCGSILFIQHYHHHYFCRAV